MTYDNTSEILLTILRDTGEPLGTGTLREESDFDQNKPILDRLRRLRDQGLVEVSHTEELPGAAADRQYWEITKKGRNWVDENRGEITETTARQVEKALQRTLERVDNIDEEMQTLNGKIDRWQKTMNRRSKRLSRLDSKVDEKTDKAIEASDESWNKAHSVESRVNEIEDEIEELHKDIEELTDAIESEREARQDAIDRLGEWAEDEIGKIQRIAQTAREDAKKARQRGIIDILTGN